MPAANWLNLTLISQCYSNLGIQHVLFSSEPTYAPATSYQHKYRITLKLSGQLCRSKPRQMRRNHLMFIAIGGIHCLIHHF